MAEIVWDRKVLARLIEGLDIPEDRSECWLWKRCINKGYGKISVGVKLVSIHRLVYTIFMGEIPDGKLVCHSCDNRLCGNPAHLWVGSNTDNMYDMTSKGRSIRGEQRNSAKLKSKDIPKIRRMLACGYTLECIGKVFGVTSMTISRIKSGLTWKDIR